MPEVAEAVERDEDVVKHEEDEAVVLPEVDEVEPLLEVPRSTLMTTRPSQAWHKASRLLSH